MKRKLLRPLFVSLLILFILGAVAATVYLSQSSQDLRSRASTKRSPSLYLSPSKTNDKSLNVYFDGSTTPASTTFTSFSLTLSLPSVAISITPTTTTNTNTQPVPTKVLGAATNSDTLPIYSNRYLDVYSSSNDLWVTKLTSVAKDSSSITITATINNPTDKTIQAKLHSKQLFLKITTKSKLYQPYIAKQSIKGYWPGLKGVSVELYTPGSATPRPTMTILPTPTAVTTTPVSIMRCTPGKNTCPVGYSCITPPQPKCIKQPCPSLAPAVSTCVKTSKPTVTPISFPGTSTSRSQTNK